MTDTEHKPRHPRLKKWLRRTLAAAGIAALAFAVACTAVVWFLSPERLTPIIEKVASEKLNADVTLSRAELTFWSSFPNIKVEVSDLRMRSRSLDTLPADVRSALPQNADSLLYVGHFSGSIDILKALGGRIALNDVIIDRPTVNMLQATPEVSNFSILPAPDPDKPSSPIPDISIHRFAITNAGPITYNSIPDTLHLDLTLNTIDLKDRGLPLYELTVDTDIDIPALRTFDLNRLRVNLDGNIRWDGADPYTLDISRLMLKLDGIDVTVDTSVDFRDSLTVKSLDIDVNSLDINSLKKHLPPSQAAKFSTLSTDMKVDLKLRLDKPLCVSDTLGIPAATLSASITPCHIDYGDIHWQRFATDFSVTTSGHGLADARADITSLSIDGRALDVKLSGTLADIFNRPSVDADVAADIDLGQLPKVLAAKIPGKVSGRVDMDSRLKFNLSDLSHENFHRAYIDGNVSLTGVKFVSADSTDVVESRTVKLGFGTRRQVRGSENQRVDSMLMVTVTVDTLHVAQHHHRVDIADFRGSFASVNKASTSDTTRINPFGGTVEMRRMNYFSTHDSVAMRINSAKGLATLQRFRGNSRQPQIGLDVNIDRVRVTSRDMSSVLSDSRLAMTAHLRKRFTAGYTPGDSTRRRTRRVSTESAESAAVDTASLRIDFDFNNTFRKIIQRWNATGSLHSSRGSLRLRGMDLRNRLRNLDASFTCDSVALNSLDLYLGRSDLHIAGNIANIRRAMDPERPGTLKMNFNIACDTLNVNQIVQSMAGGPRTDISAGDDDDNDTLDTLEQHLLATSETPDTLIGPLLLPVNIDAALHVGAQAVIYSDLLLNNFQCDVLISNGILQLHDIAARNACGSLKMSAVYAAPNPDDLNVGVGMMLDNFHLDRIPRIVPGIVDVVPMLGSFSGTVNAHLAATVDLNRNMDMEMPTLRAAVNISGDSLAVVDNKAMRTAAKWLMFKNKKITRIDSVNVNITVRDNLVHIYPFLVNVDRYRLGIMGTSDMGQNLNYHIAVLKSPIPFKFGINIKGSAEKPKIRFGGARLKPDMVTRRDAIADTIRINLVREMNAFFRKGIHAARLGPLDIRNDSLPELLPEAADPVITASDSLMLIDAGLIEVPDSIVARMRANAEELKPGN